MKLSIIIVNYNVTYLLRNCLVSIERYVQNLDYEVIVVDNDSPDHSWTGLIQKFPNVKFIESKNNDGFAIANNKAIELAKGQYVLLLNPDTELEGFYMSEILSFADSKSNFGCLGIRLHDRTGKFLPESKRNVPNLYNSFEKLFVGFKRNNSRSYYRNDIDEFATAKVDVVTGAFLLAKRNVYLEVGGLDEQYFMYGEDIDFCYSLIQQKFKNWYLGKYSLLHHKGESTVRDILYLNRFYGAMQIFITKYYKEQKPVQYKLLSAGLKLKLAIERFTLK